LLKYYLDTIHDTFGWDNTCRRALRATWGLDAVVGLLALLIVIAMGLSPLAALATLATLIGRVLMRRRQRHGVGG
jgi:hypothetical protein